MLSFFIYFVREVLGHNKPVKEELVRNAEMTINEVIYVPAETMISPNVMVGSGDFRTVFMPSFCTIKFEYKGKEYMTKDEGFLVKKFGRLEGLEGETIKQDIRIKTYKNGYVYIGIVD